MDEMRTTTDRAGSHPAASYSGQTHAAPRGTLEQCKRAVLALPPEERRQLILWLAGGMYE